MLLFYCIKQRPSKHNASFCNTHLWSYTSIIDGDITSCREDITGFNVGSYLTLGLDWTWSLELWPWTTCLDLSTVWAFAYICELSAGCNLVATCGDLSACCGFSVWNNLSGWPWTCSVCDLALSGGGWPLGVFCADPLKAEILIQMSVSHW